MSGDTELTFLRSQSYSVGERSPTKDKMLGPRSPVIVGIIVMLVVGILCTVGVLFLVLKTGEDIRMLQEELRSLKHAKATSVEALQNTGMRTQDDDQKTGKDSSNTGANSNMTTSRGIDLSSIDTAKSIVIALDNVTGQLDVLVENSRNIYKMLSSGESSKNADNADQKGNMTVPEQIGIEKEIKALEQNIAQYVSVSKNQFDNIKQGIVTYGRQIQREANETMTSLSTVVHTKLEGLMFNISQTDQVSHEVRGQANDSLEGILTAMMDATRDVNTKINLYLHDAETAFNSTLILFDNLSAKTLNQLSKLYGLLSNFPGRADSEGNTFNTMDKEQGNISHAIDSVTSTLHDVLVKLGAMEDQLQAADMGKQFAELGNSSTANIVILQNMQNKLGSSQDEIHNHLKNMSANILKYRVGMQELMVSVQDLQKNTNLGLNGINHTLVKRFNNFSEAFQNATVSTSLIAEVHRNSQTFEEKLDVLHTAIGVIKDMQNDSLSTNAVHRRILEQTTKTTLDEMDNGFTKLSHGIRNVSIDLAENTMNISGLQAEQARLNSLLTQSLSVQQLKMSQISNNLESYHTVMDNVSNYLIAQGHALGNNLTKEMASVQNKVDAVVGILIHHDSDMLRNVKHGFDSIASNISFFFHMAQKNIDVVSMRNATEKQLASIDSACQQLTSEVDVVKTLMNDTIAEGVVMIATDLDQHIQDVNAALTSVDSQMRNQSSLSSTIRTLNTKIDNISAALSRIASGSAGVSLDVTTRGPEIIVRGNARLVNVTRAGGRVKGRLEVYHSNQWGTVCDDSFDADDAKVACVMLGYSEGGSKPSAYFGAGSGQIWLDDLQCSGLESSLFDCHGSAVGTHNCGHSEDVGVICS